MLIISTIVATFVALSTPIDDTPKNEDVIRFTDMVLTDDTKIPKPSEIRLKDTAKRH